MTKSLNDRVACKENSKMEEFGRRKRNMET